MASTHTCPLNDANRLGLAYRHEASLLPWHGPIWDVHVHLRNIEAARLYFEVAGLFGVQRAWTMTNLEEMGAVAAEFGDRLEFIAVPNYQRRHEPDTFTTDWLARIEAFASRGVRICKFWGAPRGRDFHPALRLDSPIRREGMKLARSLGMIFMVHVADPDTWFATHYRDRRRYGTKPGHHAVFEQLLDEFGEVPVLAAHMAGHPEDLDHVQALLDRHPNLYVDTSATKWMVRELSRHPHRLRMLVEQNPGRILFGTDIVAESDSDFDLLASRFWALRTLLETGHAGPSPIVDPDLSLLDPQAGDKATAMLRGARLEPHALHRVYRSAAEDLISKAGR